MEKAFAKGYDPALELTKTHIPGKPDSDAGAADGAFNLRRKEQDTIDDIIQGKFKEPGYFMLLGPKVSTQLVFC